ncbi:hypothetical protein TNCV_213701 [Trichonephila clavipes]|nr:hypothetical protein TNCV_213701 [Trichonephila clavipes]
MNFNGFGHVGLPRNEVVNDPVKAAASNPVDPEDHMVLTWILHPGSTPGKEEESLPFRYDIEVPLKELCIAHEPNEW